MRGNSYCRPEEVGLARRHHSITCDGDKRAAIIELSSLMGPLVGFEADNVSPLLTERGPSPV